MLRLRLTFALALALACESTDSPAPEADTATTDVAAPDAGQPDDDAANDDDSGAAPDVAVGDTAQDPPDVGPSHPALVGTVPAAWTARPGVEIVTAMGVAPGTPLTLYDADGKRLVTYRADEFGNCHIAYLPREYAELDLVAATDGELVRTGHVLRAGDGYVLRDDSADPPAAFGPFRVLAVGDVPDTALYDGQTLTGVTFGLAGVPADQDVDDGFNYIEMRDGVLLSAMVRLPDPALYGPGPYPTVVTYSGYSPSRHDEPDASARFATLLGYATVGVNMRGSGCSGGVFDIFSPAQHADGYDIIEAVARQPWVLHHTVGMIGVSYPGISQLYVAYTRPPSLSAITPLSVLLDPWIVLRPGGIYNDGFTRQWLAERDAEASAGGQSWTDVRIADGDTLCAKHQELRHQNLKFEKVFRELEFYPEAAVPRSMQRFVDQIQVPVYLTGAFQDEQTGPQFMDMLGSFTGAPTRRFILYNGRHGDGYSPMVVTRWWEFLELFVAKRVPRLPDFIRAAAASELSKAFDSEGLTLEPDRFADLDANDLDGALERYAQEPEVRVLFESGGDPQQPGAPGHRFEASFDAWPPPEAATTRLYLADAGALLPEAPATAGTTSFLHDPESGAKTFFGPKGYQFSARLWDFDWTPFETGRAARFTTPPLGAPLTLGGPGYLELHVSSTATDVHLQVTLSEVRPDGNETLIGTGWHRVGHAAIDDTVSHGNFVQYTFAEADFSPLVPGEQRQTRVPLPGLGHHLRAGSRLRVTISTPGRDHGTWEFANPDYGDATPTHTLAFGGATPSALVLSTLSTPDGVPADYPPCPGLRGQACRPAVMQ